MSVCHLPRRLCSNYNEVVVNFEAFSQRLPHAVEAVYFPASSQRGEEWARGVRDEFRRTFDVAEGMPPLLRYDGTRTPAFELVLDEGQVAPPPPPCEHGCHDQNHNRGNKNNKHTRHGGGG